MPSPPLAYHPVDSAADAPAAICAWSDASTLAAYLTSASTVTPGGSGLRLAAGAVWPMGWEGSCVTSPEVCSPPLTLALALALTSKPVA